VRARAWGAVAAAVVAVVWGGVGYLSTRPTDFHSYRVAAVGSAQSAYTGLVSGQQASRALAASRIPPPMATAMLGDSRSAIAGAQKRLARDAPPDERTTAMRDELAPLLLQADAAISGLEDAVAHGGAVELRARADAADPVADHLRRFVEEHG